MQLIIFSIMQEIWKNTAYIKRYSSRQALFSASQLSRTLDKFDTLFYQAWKGFEGDSTMLAAMSLRSGILKSRGGWTALHSAVWNMHTEVVKFLLGLGNCKEWQKNVVRDYSLLHFAVRNRDLETLGLLLAAKADVDFFDSKGRTALHETAICGDSDMTRDLLTADMAKALLAAGANKDRLDSEGKTPRDYAILRGANTDWALTLL
jgi:ankyrin repeat protein